MLDYQLDVAPLLADGLSNADVAAALSAKTSGPIKCSDARRILFESGAVVEDPVTRVRSGALIDYYSGLPDGADKSLLGWFISHCETGDEIGTNEYPRSVQWSGVVAGMPDDLKSLSGQLIDSAGGLGYGEVSEEEVAASVAAYEASQADIDRQNEILALQARIENDFINAALSDGESTASQIIESIKAGL
jgi:hypothetical protein